MVKYRKTGRTTEYYVKESDWGIRRRSIASPHEPRHPFKELPDPEFEVNGPTSTAIKRIDVIHRRTSAPLGQRGPHETPSTSRPKENASPEQSTEKESVSETQSFDKHFGKFPIVVSGSSEYVRYCNGR